MMDKRRLMELAGVPVTESSNFKHRMTNEHLMDIDKAVNKAVDVLMSYEGMDEVEAKTVVIDRIKLMVQ